MIAPKGFLVRRCLTTIKAARDTSIEIERAVLEALGYEVKDRKGWWGHSGCRAPGETWQSLPGITTDQERLANFLERELPKRYGWRLERTFAAGAPKFLAEITNTASPSIFGHREPTLALMGAYLEFLAGRT